MTPGTLNLCILRGIAFGVTMQLFEDDGTTPVDLTGKTPRALARRLPTSQAIDLAPTVTDYPTGILHIALTTAETMALAVMPSGQWDLVLEDDGTTERGPRLLSGSFTVQNPSTRP
jgi:hypothetical protein